MAKVKREETQEIEEKRSAGSGALARKTEDQELKALLDNWQRELSSLQSQEFNSYDQAVGAVINGVLNRMAFEGEVRDKTREFLEDLFDADPQIEKTLREALRIKE
ncbi:MAG: hypothetical protein D6719_09900 [Candidatus Dadabacteria bacterium]|nr:MAG: hypothetical protein D6719_09900 [Candidatus Dadabacteria bacterium]